MPVTRWDGRLYVRALALAAVALALGCLLTALTDEGGVRWGERLGRTLPLLPLCSAVAAWGALSPVRSRGEAQALAALGRTRAQVSAAAVAGSATTALVAALLLVGSSRWISVAGFYPSAAHAAEWRWENGAFVDTARRVRLSAEGTPVGLETAAGPTSPSGSSLPGSTSRRPTAPDPRSGRRGLGTERVAAALAMVFSGLAFPLLIAHALLSAEAASGFSSAWARRVRRANGVGLLATGLCAALSVVLFQAAAARALPPIVAAVPPAGLLVLALNRYRADP